MCYLDNMDTLDKVLQTIDSDGLLANGDRVLVALSGGPDSVALLHILTKIRDNSDLTLYAVYINHNIRPREAQEEEQFCRDLCDGLGVDLKIIFEDIPARARQAGKGLEEAARDFRYATFERLTDEKKLDRIALGHHLDDRVETVLFRIIRGSGLTGLKGMPITRGRIIRPLFELTKSEIEQYLSREGLSFRVDESNRDDGFKRNFIRNQLLPLIRENLNESVDRALISLSETAGEDEAFLDELVAKKARRLVSRSPGGKIQLDLEQFNSYDKWLRRRLLRRCLAELSGSGELLAKEVVDRLDDLCCRQGKAVSLPEGLQAAILPGRAVIYPGTRRSYRQELKPSGRCRLEWPELRFSSCVKSRLNISPEHQRRSRRIWIDYGKVMPPLVIRNIEAGDRFAPLGMAGTKKVGDYLTDRKVDPVYRDEIPVVCDSKGIIWLVGYEIADRVKVDQATGKVLKIEVSQPKQYRLQAF